LNYHHNAVWDSMKNKMRGTVAVVIFVLLTSWPLWSQEQTDFSKQPVEARRSILASAARNAASSRDPAVVTLMRLRLRDPDARVRFYAGSMLSQLVMAGGNDRRTKRGSLLDMHSRGVPEALVPLCKDPDFRVRGSAIKGLAFIGPWSAALEALLIDTYDHETESSVRNVIVWELTISASLSPPVERVLLHAIGDTSDFTRKSAAAGLAKLRPLAGLPRLVDELRAGDVRTRPAVIHAIKSYGALAKPYIGDLEAWRWSAEAEGRSGEAIQLRQAIASINESR
jgi:HEAT repeat protein